MSNHVYLLFGGNKGNIRKNFLSAIQKLNETVGQIQMVSPLYHTKSWGFESESMFLNQVVYLFTDLSPEKLLNRVLYIEKQLGRKRKAERYVSREIDIDILFYNDYIIQTRELTIPHPLLHLRRFALCPLNDISPGLIHPVFQQSIKDLLLKCTDELMVMKVMGNSVIDDTTC